MWENTVQCSTDVTGRQMPKTTWCTDRKSGGCVQGKERRGSRLEPGVGRGIPGTQAAK